MTRGKPCYCLFPCSLSPALHVYERCKFLLLVSFEAMFLLLLPSRKFFLVSTLLQIQPVALLRLMGTGGSPVLLPPHLIEIVLVQLGCLFVFLWHCLRNGVA